MRIGIALVVLLIAAAPTVAMGPDDLPAAAPGSAAVLEEARVLAERRRAADALGLLEPLHQADPGDPDVLNLLGFASRKAGHHDAALRFYTRALAIDPGHRGALEYLGELYLETGRRDAALQTLRRLEASCPQGCPERRELEALLQR